MYFQGFTYLKDNISLQITPYPLLSKLSGSFRTWVQKDVPFFCIL